MELVLISATDLPCRSGAYW